MKTTYNEILSAAGQIGVAPTKEEMDVTGYEALQMVLQMAYEQASGGKGAERHASNGLSSRPFHGQPMQTECDEIGSVDGLVYQVRKKTREGNKLPTNERKIKEWLGAINYLAGCVIWTLRHQSETEGLYVTTEVDGRVAFNSHQINPKVTVEVPADEDPEVVADRVKAAILKEHLHSAANGASHPFDETINSKVRFGKLETTLRTTGDATIEAKPGSLTSDE